MDPKKRKKQQDIAIFRYGLIAPVLHRKGQGQGEYFRKMAEQEFDVPGLGAKCRALKDGFLRHGLPRSLYCDNGPAFSSKILLLACARLQIALIHSMPYDSPSRGKIERFFRTVRELFLAAHSEFTSLQDLNQRFLEWLESYYHRRVHSGIGETPLERYLRGRAQSSCGVTRSELDLIFYKTMNRKVRNDATVSIARVLWEVPHQYMGQIIEIRHPQDRPEELYLFEDEQAICRLHPVQLHENAKCKRPIRFRLQATDSEANS